MSATCVGCRFWVGYAVDRPLTGMCRSLRLRREAKRDLARRTAPIGGPVPPYVITWHDDVCEFFEARQPEQVNDAEGD